MQEALYRKYRPDSLKKLVGQPDAVALIEKQVKNNNLSHAYLFSGPRGVGKTSLARIIATTLGCDPVFDITEIDAASHNKVDDIRELNDSINFIASSPGKKRVFILDEVHMLSNAASNAFLKTLEEPPEHVIFILATTEPERVLETIKSRTTHIAFKRIGNDEIISTLNEIGKNEKIKINDDVLSYIANQSDGSLRDAINLFEQTHNTFGNKATIDDLYSILGKVSIADLQQIIESINTQDTSKILNILKANYSKGLQPLDILNSITELFRNIFYFKYLPDDDTFLAISESENTLVKDSNEFITAKQLSRVLDLLDELNQTIVNAPSQELKLELFLIKLIKPQLASDIKSISRRIDLLEGEQNIQEDVVKEIPSSKQTPKPKQNTEKKTKSTIKAPKKDLENFDVYWPKILEELREKLSSRKFSYLTAVSPEVESNGALNLFVDKDNEFLLKELEKSEEVIDLLISEVAEKMGINVNIKILLSEKSKSGDSKGLDAAQEVFEVEDLN